MSNLTQGMPAQGNAKLVACPVCHAAADKRCVDAEGRVVPYHVERGRVSRWAAMGID